MITALCLNPSVDRTVTVREFIYGGTNRIESVREDGGGKGVNVAVACRQLGLDAACVGFLANAKAEAVTGRLESAGCPYEFVRTEGAVRTNLKVMDLKTRTVTEFNEPGSPVSPDGIERLVALAVRWSRQSGWLVLTGSAPPGCPDDIYARIIGEIRRDNPCRCVLDAGGEPLRLGIAARPYMVKPNRYELEELFGRALPRTEDVLAAAKALVDGGIRVAAVSLGKNGAVVTDGAESFFAPALDVPVKSTVGAGDSMVAGYLRAFDADMPLGQALAHAVAAASASVMSPGTRLIDAGAYIDLASRVRPAPV